MEYIRGDKKVGVFKLAEVSGTLKGLIPSDVEAEDMGTLRCEARSAAIKRFGESIGLGPDMEFYYGSDILGALKSAAEVVSGLPNRDYIEEYERTLTAIAFRFGMRPTEDRGDAGGEDLVIEARVVN